MNFRGRLSLLAYRTTATRTKTLFCDVQIETLPRLMPINAQYKALDNEVAYHDAGLRLKSRIFHIIRELMFNFKSI